MSTCQAREDLARKKGSRERPQILLSSFLASTSDPHEHIFYILNEDISFLVSIKPFQMISVIQFSSNVLSKKICTFKSFSNDCLEKNEFSHVIIPGNIFLTFMFGKDRFW